jgi:tRNA threonylcarbamoyladenosine biosynthesis protein TsaE
MTEQFICSEEEMSALGIKVASQLKGGEIFALTGDLGAGKTTFVKSLVYALGSSSTATSPTFNLVHRYPCKNFSVIHYDLYRLKKFGEIEALDLEDQIQENKSVIAIEWPKLVESVLPKDRTRWVTFEEMPDGKRKIVFTSL